MGEGSQGVPLWSPKGAPSVECRDEPSKTDHLFLADPADLLFFRVFRGFQGNRGK